MQSLHLFAGIGGAALGFQRAGIQPVAMCDINPVCRRVLAKHWPDAQMFDDVCTLKKEDLRDRIDIITGGFPCQDISLAGAGAGLAGARSGLWFEQLRIVEEVRPSYMLAENVSALRSRGLDAVLWSLAEIGYDAEWHCIPASAVGAPHQRDRIFILAYPHSSSGGQSSDPQRDSQPQAGSKVQLWNDVDRFRDTEPCAALAYPDSFVGDARRASDSCEGKRGRNFNRSGVGSDALADAGGDHVQGQLSGSTYTQEWQGQIERSAGPCRDGDGWWAAEPGMGRVAHGVPGRVDRLKQLGNSVVPQVTEAIARIILTREMLK